VIDEILNKRTIILRTDKSNWPMEGRINYNGLVLYLLSCLFRKARVIKGKILVPAGSKIWIKPRIGELIDIEIDGERINNVSEIKINDQKGTQEGTVVKLLKPHYVETVNFEDDKNSVYYVFDESMIFDIEIYQELSLLYELGARVTECFAPYPGFVCNFEI
jgi:hypothetical protein